MLPALHSPGVAALALAWLRLGETGHRCSLFNVKCSGWGARWLPPPEPGPLCCPLPCRPGTASMGHVGWRIALPAAQGLSPGTALRQPVQPWCPDAAWSADWCPLHCSRCPGCSLSLVPLASGSRVCYCRVVQAMHAENESNTSRAMRLAAGCRLCWDRCRQAGGAACAGRHQRCGWASLKVPALGCYAFLDSARQVLNGCIHIGLLDGLLQEGALLIP